MKILRAIIECQQSEIAALKSELRSDVLQQQQSEIAALKAELVEVKALLTATPTPQSTATLSSYAAMAAGPVPHQPRPRPQQPRPRAVRQSQNRREPVSTATATTPAVSQETNELKRRHTGARRVWGTLSTVTTQTAAVVSTLKRLTKIGGKVRVFRKSRTNRLGKACWWFHLKGDESDLCELEKEWKFSCSPN